MVHGDDGLDELTTTDGLEVLSLERRRDPHVRGRPARPRARAGDHGAAAGRAPGGERRRSRRACSTGKPGPHRDIVMLNAGAALMVAGARCHARRGHRDRRRGDRRRAGGGGARAVRARFRRTPRRSSGAVSAVVRVPASSANLGPGVRHARHGVGPARRARIRRRRDTRRRSRGRRAPSRHRSRSAGRVASAASGSGRRSRSVEGWATRGAVRVGGLVAAHLQHHGPAEDDLIAARPHWLSVATELEGHADNVAASIFGGVVAAGRRVEQCGSRCRSTRRRWCGRRRPPPRPKRHGPRCRRRCRSRMRSSTSGGRRCSSPRSPPATSLRYGRRPRIGCTNRCGFTPLLRRASHSRRRWRPARGVAGCRARGRPIATLCRHDAVDAVVAAMAALPEPASTKVLRLDHAGAVIEAS